MEIQEIVENKKELVKLKKAATKITDGWSTPFQSGVSKSIQKESNNNAIDKTIVGNTYYWMDSHDDVHVKGCFSKSLKENNNIFHLHDHEFKIAAQIGDISKAYETELDWSVFGVNKQGTTTALLADSNIKKAYNERIFNDYNNGKINQHSVGMQYVKIDLAVNDEEYPEEYKFWSEIFPLIGNQDKALDKGYFWIVRECKLIEISAVLMGSNTLTPTLEDKQEPSGDTLADKAAAQALQLNNFYNNLKL